MSEEGEMMGNGKSKAELDRLVKMTVEQINDGAVTLDKVLATIAPQPVEEAAPATLPVPREITQEEEQALVKVSEVFGKVTPTERRKLTPEEISKLIEEKETLDTLKKMADSRLDEGVKVAIHNHLDVEAEEQGLTKDARRNANGHYIIGGEARGTANAPKRFTREVRNPKPSINAARLQELVDHDTWLAITRPERVLDENKLMLALRKNPELILKMAEATEIGKPVVSINLRKA